MDFWFNLNEKIKNSLLKLVFIVQNHRFHILILETSFFVFENLIFDSIPINRF
jgi:hypothetical protein